MAAVRGTGGGGSGGPRSVTRRPSQLVGLVRRLRQHNDPAAEIDAIAAVAERLAVLLSAGVPAPTAWGHLGEAGDDRARGNQFSAETDGGGSGHGSDPAADRGRDHSPGREADRGPNHASDRGSDRRYDRGSDRRPDRGTDRAAADAAVLAAAAGAAAQGEPVAPAIVAARAAAPAASSAWPVLAAAWSVAEESGAPLAASLRHLAAGLRDEAQVRREVRAALAGPAASARLVTTLPLLAVLFGTTLGFGTIAVLFANPLGLACLAVGSALLWVGRRWNATLAARASRGRGDAGLELELLAIAMSSGASIERARDVVGRGMADHRLAADSARDVDAVLELAARAGAPVAELLRAEALRLRRAARAAGAERAAALGVRLMVPLGLCVLPSFVLLGVAPLMISVISGTLGGAA